MSFKRVSIVVIIVLLAAILVSDTGVLVYEKKIEPGHKYIVAEHGDLGKNKQSSLVCKYFTGRKILTRVYWYSSNNIFGRSTCQFLINTLD